MFIKTVKIRDFGVIDDINFSLSPQKVNMIIGGNATGKTTFLSALFALFFDDKILSYPSIEISEHEKPSFLYLSGGSKIIINLICMISNMPFNSVLVGDGIFSGIDSLMSAKLLDFLDKVDGIQFIFLENCDVTENSNRSVIRQYLKPESKQQNRLYFSNDLYDILRNRCESLMQDDSLSNNAIELKNYYLGEKVDMKEGRDYEFKEILGKNPCESIIKMQIFISMLF